MSRLDLDAAAWNRLNELLDAALDRSPAERAAWLASLGPEHESLKSYLTDLLSRAAAVEAGAFLDMLPRFEGLAGSAEDSRVGAAGEVIGQYRLVRELGSGGMGTVWLAERVDGLITRPVALKLPHLVATRRTDIAERMAREREILATLDHRNIARLLDAGVTDDGQPFLALEYVEGIAIDRYCASGDGGKALDLRSRLRLFRQVADAVAYAHGKLIVHRDLKPANVLVTSGGGVKLLDFGIAKLLEEGSAKETRLTELSGRALTLDYASPEQIRGEPLTVASDVYSLGVMLFELLTGERPYRLKRVSPAAIEEAILMNEPRRPSALTQNRELRGDLDTIVLKALKKNPAERYVTVHALVDDVRRWLDHRPVLAQPDRIGYRLHKFLRRNRVATAVTVAFALAVITGAAVSVWQMFEARAQRDAALLHQRRAEAFSQFLGVILHDAGGGGTPLTSTALLERGVAMLEGQRNMDMEVTAFMWYEVARSFRLVSQTDRERAMLERSIAGARRIGDNNLAAAGQCALAWSLLERDQARAQQVFASAREVLSAEPHAADYAQLECLRAESRLLQVEGDPAGAITLIEAARPRIETLRQRQGFHYALIMDQLAGLYRAVERNKDSLAISASLLQSLRDNGRGGSMAEMMLMSSHARDLCRVGEILDCFAIHEEVLQRAARAQMQRLPPVGIRFRAGVAAQALGRYDRSLELADAELEIARASGNRAALGNGLLLRSSALLQLKRFDEAARDMAEAERLWNANPGAFAPLLREAGQFRVELALARGELANARVAMETLLAQTGDGARPDAGRSDRLLRLAARVALDGQDAARAERLAGEALTIARRDARHEDRSANVGLAALLRAESRERLGRRADALVDVALAIRALTNALGPEHAESQRARALAASWSAPAA
jgi:tetratricopeptide (TPR) repeat protein